MISWLARKNGKMMTRKDKGMSVSAGELILSSVDSAFKRECKRDSLCLARLHLHLAPAWILWK